MSTCAERPINVCPTGLERQRVQDLIQQNRNMRSCMCAVRLGWLDHKVSGQMCHAPGIRRMQKVAWHI